jgi:serpin B
MSKLRNCPLAVSLVAGAMVLGCHKSGGEQLSVVPEPPTVAAELQDEPVTAPPEDVKAVADGNTAFAIDLFKKLAEQQPDGNLVVSPYSISTTLAMTYAGARGETAAEMRKVLHFALPDDRLHPALGAIAQQLQSDGRSHQLIVANALWGQRGVLFRGEFQRLTRKHYRAGLREIDFVTDSASTRRTINAWVGEQTRGKIPELLKPADLSEACKLILTNAVYFKADWAFPFRTEFTKDGPFNVAEGKTITVPLMAQTATLLYAECDSARVVELQYSGSSFSMVVILPVKPQDLSRVEDALAGGALDRWLNCAEPREVDLTLPKFRLRMAATLDPLLEELGLQAAFTPAADFTGLAATGGLRINRVVHEACVEVDEKGTVAVAATAAVVNQSSVGRVTFAADHPFLFLIRDRATTAILFYGRVANPTW